MLRTDAAVFGITLLVLAGLSYWAGWPDWQGLSLNPPSLQEWLLAGGILAIVILLSYLHFITRKLVARGIAKRLGKDIGHTASRETLLRAFRKNTRWMHSVFSTKPVGWGPRARKRIAKVVSDADGYVQTLNDRFTNPSGDETEKSKIPQAPVAVATPPPPAEPAAEEEQPKQVATGS